MAAVSHVEAPVVLELESCPGCGSTRIEPVSIPTDVTLRGLRHAHPILIDDSDYHLCMQCDLLFARRRHDPNAGDDYYASFIEVFIEAERRDYAVYPPPLEFVRNQTTYACEEVERLHAAGLIADDARVLHVRCECGSHLAYLRHRFGVDQVFGLDYFESNVRYARDDLGLENVALLRPWKIDPQFETREFDLILANHQMTHALDPRTALVELVGLLSERGVLVLSGETDHGEFLARYGDRNRGVNNFHTQLFTRNSLLNLCRAAGFDAQLVHYYPTGLRWARPHCSLSVAARPREGPASAFETDPDNLRRAIAAWDRRARGPSLRERIGRRLAS